MPSWEFEIGDGFIVGAVTNRGALKCGWQETGTPTADAIGSGFLLILHDHECRQFLCFRYRGRRLPKHPARGGQQ